jgi:hypothetical protein
MFEKNFIANQDVKRKYNSHYLLAIRANIQIAQRPLTWHRFRRYQARGIDCNSKMSSKKSL